VNDPEPRSPFEIVAGALRTLCRDALPDLTPDTWLDELPRMDSLRMLHVIAMLEDQLGVEIDVAILGHLHRVRDIEAAVRAALSSARGASPST
jgi:acyl carrier protein